MNVRPCAACGFDIHGPAVAVKWKTAVAAICQRCALSLILDQLLSDETKESLAGQPPSPTPNTRPETPVPE